MLRVGITAATAASSRSVIRFRACHRFVAAASAKPVLTYTTEAINNGNGGAYRKASRWTAAIVMSGAVAASLLQQQDSNANAKLEGNCIEKEGDNSEQMPIATSIYSAPMSHTAPKDLPKIATGIRALNNALQKNHERQKVQLGRLLHEFHALAQEALESSEADLSKSTSKEAKEQTASTSPTSEHEFCRLTEEDLTKITPDAVWGYVDRLKEGAVFDCQDVKRIASAASEAFLKEPTLIDLRSRKDLKSVVVVGDLHGQFSSLLDVLNLARAHDVGETPWDGTAAIVFNGDFVDRGDQSLEVMLTLLLLKLAHPKHVFLNRGNHEDGVLSTVYGYSDELQTRYGAGSVDNIWKSFEDVFASLPICVRTEHAAILHGGIPSDSFNLSDLQQIAPAQRFRIKSMLEPGDDELCKLIQNILWSDPRPESGIEPNEDRGAGMRFGPDVLARFLSRNGIRHLVRSHEPVDAGYEHLESGNGHSAVTVFSAASYPNGEGFNAGAIIRLNPDGTLSPASFEAERPPLEEEENRTFKALARLIAQNRSELEAEFAYYAEKNKHRQTFQNAFSKSDDSSLDEDDVANSSSEDQPVLINRGQWAEVMGFVLDLSNLDWLSLQPYLAPIVAPAQDAESPGSDAGMIDYRRFLNLHCNLSYGGSDETQNADEKALAALHQNHAALLTVFKFLDTDRNGEIDRQEFRRGISLLAKRLSGSNNGALQLEDPDALFDTLDLDGNGTIELEEFERVFQAAEMPYAEAVFKIFDTDKSGTIDRIEFREGMKLLNARLKPTEQIGDPDALFDTLDDDGSEEIDLDEFKKMCQTYFPQL